MSEHKIKYVIWDWNGTLVDDVQASVNAINCMLARRNLSATTIERYRETFGFPVKDYYRITGFHLEQEDWDAMSSEYHDIFLADPDIHIHPAAKKTLKACRDAGLELGLLSAAEQSILERMLEKFDAAHFFNHIMGTDNLYGHSKIARGRDLLRCLAMPAACVLFVGDTLHDYEVAVQMGCRCLLISGGHQTQARLTQSGCQVLEDLADVPDWIARENRT